MNKDKKKTKLLTYLHVKHPSKNEERKRHYEGMLHICVHSLSSVQGPVLVLAGGWVESLARSLPSLSRHALAATSQAALRCAALGCAAMSEPRAGVQSNAGSERRRQQPSSSQMAGAQHTASG